MTKSHIEPYAKENNLLQLSLFYFGKGRPEKTVVEWEDNDGNYKLECVCKYGVPGSFDQDVYTACMRIWVKQGMPPNFISLNYSQIGRELHLFPIKDWVSKIKKSLRKLAQTRYEFNQCFVKADKNGNRLISTHFSLFDSVILFDHRKGQSKKKSESELVFPDLIRENLEAKYYQFLDMVWYRALPEGLPRRMYEYLAKRRYHNVNGVFTIAEEALCRWLPILDKNVTNRRKRLANIAQALIDAGFLEDYVFDKSKKMCIFTYAKDIRPKVDVTPDEVIAIETKSQTTTNTVDVAAEKSRPKRSRKRTPATPRIPQEKISSGCMEILKWLDSIPYLHQKKKDKILILPIEKLMVIYPNIRKEYDDKTAQGDRPKASWVFEAFTKSEENDGKSKYQILAEEERKKHFAQEMFFWADQEPSGARNEKVTAIPKVTEENSSTLELEDLLKRKSKKLIGIMKKYVASHGYEYVYWNVLYANKHAKKNYSTYLQKSLNEDWAGDWAEEEKAQQLEDQKKEREREEKVRVQEKAKKNAQQNDEDKTVFLENLARLSTDEAKSVWQVADQEIPKKQLGREMLVKIRYSELLLDILDQHKISCSREILKDIQFIRKIQIPV